MKNLYRVLRPVPAIGILLFILLMILFPTQCTDGAATGLLLCGRVIVPSLFPFTVCVLFLMRSGAMRILSVIEPFSQKIFHQSGNAFAVMLLSFIGGYPVGAKLINELYCSGGISKKNAHLMQCCCVNAGPAFIVLAVGSSLLHSRMIGYLLLAAHLSASLLLAVIAGRFAEKPRLQKQYISHSEISFTDNFVQSTADAAAAVFGICGYVILFSTVSSYLTFFSPQLPFLNYLQAITEVTTAVYATKNIYLISFLLGFSGLSVWCQVLSVSKNVGLRPGHFILFRILHGAVSLFFTILLIKIFKPQLPVVSNGVSYTAAGGYSTAALSISLITMAVLLIISFAGKNQGGKIKDDLI